MDPLAHVFLPLLVVYAVRPGLFERPWPFGLAGFGLLPDADKFLGLQGLGHSLVTLVPLGVLVWAGARYVDVDEAESYAVVGLFFIASHIVLDTLDGGPTPLLYPFVHQGVGVVYPATVAFGEGWVGFVVRGPVIAFRTVAPRSGYQSFGFLNGFGLASALAFLSVVLGRRLVHNTGDRP